jgi:FkbM family methyltransferase
MSPDCRVAEAIRRDGVFEPESIDAWKQACGWDDFAIAIDVGAYSGLYAITAAMKGKEAIALEPRPHLVDLIQKNAGLNRVSVKVMTVAASDSDGRADLYWDPRSPMNATARFKPKATQTHKQSVPVTRIDSIPFAAKVGAIKIDVEGHEAAVLRGAASLIRRDMPVLIVETMDHEDRKQAVMDLLPHHLCRGFLDRRNLLMVPR